MANHSSAKKAIRQIQKRTAVNKNRMSRIRTFLKKAVEVLTSDSAGEVAQQAFRKAQSEIARGVKAGIIKKNTAARRISNLAKKINVKA